MPQLPVKLLCSKCSQPSTFSCERCLEPYCSADCQIRDWISGHKKNCFQMPNLVPLLNVLQVGATTPSNNSLKSCDKSGDDNGNYLDPTPTTNTTKTVSNALDKVVGSKSSAWKTYYEPPENKFFDVIIQFVEPSNSSLVWVTDVKYDASLCKLHSETIRNICKADYCKEENLRAGELVAAEYKGIYYRGELREVNPKTQSALVRLVDYGNKINVLYSELREPLPIMSNLNAYAFPVHMPEMCFPLEIESIFSIRLHSGKTPEGAYIAEVKPKSVILRLPLEFISQNPEVILKQVFNDGQLGLLQLTVTDYSNALDAFLKGEVMTTDYQFETTPKEGAFVAVRTRRHWHRARLLGYCEAVSKFLVYLIDEGCVRFSKSIHEIPEKFLLQPIRIIAITTSTNHNLKELLGAAGKLSLKLLPYTAQLVAQKEPHNSLPCALYVRGKRIVDVTVSTFTGFLNDLKIKYWSEQICHGETVYITKVVSPAEVFIASILVKEYPILFATLFAKCALLEPDCTVNEGDIVLAASQGDSTYFRGKVLSRSTDPSHFELLDIDNGSINHSVPRTLLRKPNHFVRCCPVYLKKVKLVNTEHLTQTVASDKALASLNEYQLKGVEFEVKFATSKSDTADLIFKNGSKQSLSKSLMPLYDPSPEGTADSEKGKNTAVGATRKTYSSVCENTSSGAYEINSSGSTENTSSGAIKKTSSSDTGDTSLNTLSGATKSISSGAIKKSSTGAIKKSSAGAIKKVFPGDTENTSGAYENKSSGSTENISSGAYENTSSGAYENTSSGAYENTSSGAYENTSSGAIKKRSTGAIKKSSSGAFKNIFSGDTENTSGAYENTSGAYENTSSGATFDAERTTTVRFKNNVTQSRAAQNDEPISTESDIAPNESTPDKFYSLEDIEVVPLTEGDHVQLYILDASSIIRGYVTASDYGNKQCLLQMHQHFKDINTYGKSHQLDEEYKPRLNELCVAVFDEDGDWYRGLCKGHRKDSILICFIDYGNTAKVATQNVLPITKELMFPTNANVCSVKGITQEQSSRFIEAIAKNPLVNCKVTKGKEATYNVEINDLDKLLAP